MKPTQLLGGRERDLEGNPDFSTKDLTGHQQAPLAPPGPVRAPVAAPSQPLELPPEPPGSASLPSIPPTPTSSQVIYVTCVETGLYVWSACLIFCFAFHLFECFFLLAALIVMLIICVHTKGAR